MNKFLKLNQLSLMIIVGVLMALSTGVSADCDMGVAVESVRKEYKNTLETCKGWPYPESLFQPDVNCLACVSMVQRKCIARDSEMSLEQLKKWRRHCGVVE